jgi:hypothetical protein
MLNTLKKYYLVLLGSVLFAAVSVDAQVFINEPKEGIKSHFTSQFVAGTGPTGVPVRLKVNGIPVDSGSVRTDGVFEFIGVPVSRGPVTFTVDMKMPGGRIVSAQRSVHIYGAPDSIIIDMPSDDLRADGRSILEATAHVVDKWGVKINDGYIVTIESDSINLGVKDIDPNTPGIQVRLSNGSVSIPVTAPKNAGSYSIIVSASGASTRFYKEFNTPIEPLMLVGSANVNAHYLSTTGDVSQLKNADLLDDGFQSDGRVAFYGRGSVWNDYLLTASYDNNRNRDRLFKEVDPDLLYSIYGDNSTVDYMAQSNNPFFVKLERNRSYALFGDFNTSLTLNELARYDRTFNGVKAHYETKSENADVFATLTDRKVVQDEIRGQGISGYYFLGKNNVVVGTEKVRVEIRDKRQNQIVLSRIEKGRFSDYEIDYTQGTLFFKQPVQSIDSDGNPVYIIVTYEAITSTVTEYSYVMGVQGEKEIAAGVRLGGIAVLDKSANDFTLLGTHAKYDLQKELSLSGEFARGFDALNKGGNAWKIDVSSTPAEKLSLRSYYRRVETGFMNQTMGAGGLTGESGSTKYGVSASYDKFEKTKLATELYRTIQPTNGSKATINSIMATGERAIGDNATIGARVENVSYDSPLDSVAKQSTLLALRGSVRPVDRLNLTTEYEHSISNSEQEQLKPSSTTIGAEYRIIDPVTLSFNQKFYGNGASASVFGAVTDLGYGTTAMGNYQIGNGISGQRNQYSIGLKNTTKISDEVTSNVQIERTRALDRNIVEVQTNDNDAVSVGFEYLPNTSYKASLKGELGKNQQSVRRNMTFGGDIKIANDFTLIDKFSYYEEERTQPVGTEETFADGTLASAQIGSPLSGGVMKKMNNIIGVAFRPVDYDWLNAIGKYEKKLEFNGMVQPQTAYNVDIVSLHTFVEPVIGLEIGTKYALKMATDEAYGLRASTVTDLYLIRAEYDLRWNNFDVAAEYRILNSRISNQANSNSIKMGYSAEIGYVAFENIHVGVGYNFVGTEERDLVGKDYWSAGPFVSFRMKFTEKILNYFNK